MRTRLPPQRGLRLPRRRRPRRECGDVSAAARVPLGVRDWSCGAAVARRRDVFGPAVSPRFAKFALRASARLGAVRARCAARTRSARLARAALPKTRFPKRARCVRRGLAFVRPIRCVRCGEAGNRGCDQAVFDYRDVRVSWPLVRFSVALRIGDLGASADQNHHTMFRSFASGLLPEGRLAY